MARHSRRSGGRHYKPRRRPRLSDFTLGFSITFLILALLIIAKAVLS